MSQTSTVQQSRTSTCIVRFVNKIEETDHGDDDKVTINVKS